MPGPSHVRCAGRSCRALRKLGIDLACCCLLHHESNSNTPSARAHRCDNNSLSATNSPPSLTQQDPAGTCREHAQAKYAKSWDTRILLASATPCLHATPRPLTRARKHAPITTYLSIAHCTRTPLPHYHHHSRASSTSSFAPPYLLHHLPTRHSPTPPVRHPTTISLAITACPRASQDT